jgi:hypothetical protein
MPCHDFDALLLTQLAHEVGDLVYGGSRSGPCRLPTSELRRRYVWIARLWRPAVRPTAKRRGDLRPCIPNSLAAPKHELQGSTGSNAEPLIPVAVSGQRGQLTRQATH